MILIKEKTIEEEFGVKIKTNYDETNMASYYSPQYNLPNKCLYLLYVLICLPPFVQNKLAELR